MDMKYRILSLTALCASMFCLTITAQAPDSTKALAARESDSTEIPAVQAPDSAVAISVPATDSVDALAPGLYTWSGGEWVLLPFETAWANEDFNGMPTDFELANTWFYVNGPSAQTKSEGKWLLVCDLQKKAFKQTPKKYDVFVRHVTPDNILIIRYEEQKRKRRYCCLFHSIDPFKGADWVSEPFHWKRLTANSFLIEADLTPGQYGAVFRYNDKTSFNFKTAFTFYIEP